MIFEEQNTQAGDTENNQKSRRNKQTNKKQLK